MRIVQKPQSTLQATNSIRSEMPIRMSGMMSGVYTSAWCMDCRRPRHLCSASAEVVPIAQEMSVASPATMSESQKLCINAPSRMFPVKIME